MIKLKKLLVEAGVITENAAMYKEVWKEFKPMSMQLSYTSDADQEAYHKTNTLDPANWAKLPYSIRRLYIVNMLEYQESAWRSIKRSKGYQPSKEERDDWEMFAKRDGRPLDGKEGIAHNKYNKKDLERVFTKGDYGGDYFGRESKTAEALMTWMRDMIPKVGPELYKGYKEIPKIAKELDTEKPNYLANHDKNAKLLDKYVELSKSIENVEGLKKVIGDSAFVKLVGTPAPAVAKGKPTGPQDMTLMVSHIKDGMAALPKKLLNALPNKTQVNQLIKKINAGDTDLDPGDPLLYQYDELLEKGVRDLMKKLGVTLQNDDISFEDDNMTVYTTIDASKMKPLEKIGFEEE